MSVPIVGQAESAHVQRDGAELPEALPVLPLRDTVPFPDTLIPLAVAQQRSVKLVTDVLAGNRMLVMAAVRSEEAEEPGPEDVHDVGVAGVVARMLKVPDGSLRILVQGTQRVRLGRFVATAPYLVARVEAAPDVVEPSRELEALSRELEILRAFDMVPRHDFLPQAVWHRAYEDAPIPIGFGQTASQPSLQALYMQLLELRPQDRVLEIGTGSGFQTAVLAQLVDHVYSVERVRELAVRAREILERLRISNVALLVGDGTIGWRRFAPFDAILVAAGGPEVPEPLLDQLAVGGRMLIPVGSRDAQRLMLVRRTPNDVLYEEVLDCKFVPLLGRFGWAESTDGGAIPGISG